MNWVMKDVEAINRELTPQEKVQLKPCPWCGDGIERARFWDQNQGNKWVAVVCGCGVVGPDVRTGYEATGWESVAISEWNNRW